MASAAKKPEDIDTAKRLRLVRQLISGGNQTAFALRIGIEVKRWNNFERGQPLSKEIALLLVKKVPGLTTDWLWLGKADGMPLRLQRELEEAGKGTTSARGSRG